MIDFMGRNFSFSYVQKYVVYIHVDTIKIRLSHIVGVNYKYNEEFCTAFGQNLRKLREAKNLSMRQLASLCDMDYNQVYRVEKGLVNTTISMVHAFAEGLEIQPQELFNFKFPVKKK